jgi:hypothetical protein
VLNSSIDRRTSTTQARECLPFSFWRWSVVRPRAKKYVASILRLDQKRTDRDHATIAISSVAISQSTVDGSLLAESPQRKTGTAAGTDRDRTPAGCDIAEASRHVAPQFGKDGGICVCLEKSGDLHRGRNSNNEAVVDGDDHARNSTAAAPFECPAYGFLWIRLSVDVGRRSRRRER